MNRLLATALRAKQRKAALRAVCTPPSPLRRCAAPSLTTPPHLRFVEVVRERGRRGARVELGMGQRQANEGLEERDEAGEWQVVQVDEVSELIVCDGQGDDGGRRWCERS